MAAGMPVVLVDPTTDVPYAGGRVPSAIVDVGGVSLTFGSVSVDNNAATRLVMPVYSFGLVLNPQTGNWDRARGSADGQWVTSTPSALSPGLAQFSKMSTADINAGVVKASRGKVFGFQIFNNTASAKFVRLYNKATAPVPGTDAALIVRRIMVPANGVASYHVGQGLDGFTNGIALVATGGLADTDTTALAANDLTINLDYY